MGKSPALRFRPRRRYFLKAAAVWGGLAVVLLVLAGMTDRFVTPKNQATRTEAKTGLLGGFVFAAVAVGYGLASHPNRYYLELTDEGFTERLLFLKWTRHWRDIECFEVGDADGRHVAFRYNDSYRSRISRWWARSSLAVWGRLVDEYGEKPDALCARLNGWRTRYAGLSVAKSDVVDDWS